MESKAYRVEVESDGCERCGHGRLWCVVGPLGVSESTMYEDEEDAQALAGALNDAFELGRRSVGGAAIDG